MAAPTHSPRVAALIEREFGVRYSVGYLPALLRGIGFSYQKARFVSDHLNEELRQQWLKRPRHVIRPLPSTRSSGPRRRFGLAGGVRG